MDLKEIRKSKKMTQREVAEKAGISLTAYQGYERGEVSPSLKKICLIAKVLGVSPAEITTEIAVPPKSFDESIDILPVYEGISVSPFLIAADPYNHLSEIAVSLNKMNHTGRQSLCDRAAEMTEISKFTKPEIRDGIMLPDPSLFTAD